MITLGSVSFLNAKPLTYGIETGAVESDFEIIATPPARLSIMLSQNELDLGLIPVAEFLKRSDYSAVAGISISSNGPVDSVILLLGKELKDVRRISVDNRSQSSTALLRIIFEIFLGMKPEYLPRCPEDNFLDGVDAGMVIGDAGLRLMYEPPPGYEVMDLGTTWTEKTGLPFVYAVFAVNKGVKLGRNAEALLESREYGLSKRKEIAETESAKLNIDEDICYKYLTERIRYDLGEAETGGMIKYSGYLAELGLCGKINHVNMYY